MRLRSVCVSLFAWGLILLAMPCLMVGCGKKGTASSAKGQVTLAGQAVPDGDLVFRPMKDTPGQAVSTKITGGKYEFAQNKGLVAGKYLVLITATNRGFQYIPDKYNLGSGLTVDLSPGANDKDFKLEAGEVTRPPAMQGEKTPPAQ